MSNNNRISIDKLQKEILKALELEVDDIEEDVQELSKEKAEEACRELQNISPHNKGEYANSWETKKGESGKGQYSTVVHNKKHYRRTHLLEFGHANRDGSRTAAQPHIRKTEDKYVEEYVKELEKRIEGK